MRIRRGHIYIADLNPPRGTEPGKIRPVVVVQTNLLNDFHPSTIVCPVTSNVHKDSKYLRIHLNAKECGLDKESDVMVDQLRGIDNRRLVRQVGAVPQKQLQELTRSLQILLDLNQI